MQLARDAEEPHDLCEDEIIKANCRAYDNIDKREARAERKEQIASKVVDRIKSIKKMIKTNVRAKLQQQVAIAHGQAGGAEVDPEA